jgi:hypothetical protein
MEALLRPTLERLLGDYIYGLSSDQLKIRGLTSLKLEDIRLREDVLHSILGLPQALIVRRARVKQLIIELPPLASILSDPILVRMSHLDVALAERSEANNYNHTNSDKAQDPRPNQSKLQTRSYGMAEKLADGALIRVDVLSLSFHTSKHIQPDRTQTESPEPAPHASLCIRGIVCRATNQTWQVQNLERVRAEQLRWKTLVTYRTVQWSSCTLHVILHKKGGSRLVIPVLEKLSGRITIVSERDRRTLQGLSTEVDIALWDATCAALDGEALTSLTSLFYAIRRPFAAPSPPRPRNPSLAGSGSTPGVGPFHSLIRVGLANLLLRIREGNLEFEVLLQGLRYWYVFLFKRVKLGRFRVFWSRGCFGI